ncbi:hypothetical protein LWI29_022880 [Acer saccharum]|uniref:Uncharacterized protein n=1 Tax=Acer saccharum TaxID=4024 RepID=A0AA39STP7_ACESA|nr:hypothetical protein LWI29_022880 [Acer saccharum]
MESNATLTRTIRRLIRQVRGLTGAVARLMGYQLDEPSDHSSDRDEERCQKSRHNVQPTAPETLTIVRSICAIECIDHMFYVVLNVCIICIHIITLGSPCKRHEVLVRVGMTRIAKQEVLPRVGMTRIGKQGVMARVGRTRIIMHGRLPRGKSALDRELAIVLVGLGVWLDIESDRAGYTGGVCTLEEFLIDVG